MRLNKFIAQNTHVSRREADDLIKAGRVTINDTTAIIGQPVLDTDVVCVDNKSVVLSKLTYIALNKPVGYVCSRHGQGAPTVYELLPEHYKQLKTVGRLDKESSGLILLTNDGDFANMMTHPKFIKDKVYEVELATKLSVDEVKRIQDGLVLDDGLSKIALKPNDTSGIKWIVTMHEGRNRQIRRTFLALGNTVTKLHRTAFGQYRLNGLQSAKYKEIEVLR